MLQLCRPGLATRGLLFLARDKWGVRVLCRLGCFIGRLDVDCSLAGIRQDIRRGRAPSEDVGDDLAPPARRRTEVDNRVHVRMVEELVPLFVDFEQLECRARAVRGGVADTLLHERIAHLARCP